MGFGTACLFGVFTNAKREWTSFSTKLPSCTHICAEYAQYARQCAFEMCLGVDALCGPPRSMCPSAYLDN